MRSRRRLVCCLASGAAAERRRADEIFMVQQQKHSHQRSSSFENSADVYMGRSAGRSAEVNIVDFFRAGSTGNKREGVRFPRFSIEIPALEGIKGDHFAV